MLWHRGVWLFMPLGVLLGLFCEAHIACHGQQATVLGAVEKVKILPWGLTLDARVDTGAAKSSMAAVDMRVTGKEVEFSLPGVAIKQRVRLPIHSWVQVRTNLGKERRPVVQMEICVAGQRLRTVLNLDDRQGLKYPMLLGRETLRGRFLVDVGRTYLHPQPCPEGKAEEGRSLGPGQEGSGMPLSPLGGAGIEETSLPGPKPRLSEDLSWSSWTHR